MEKQKLEYRSVMKFLVLEEQSQSNIHKRMVIVNNDHAGSPTAVFEWLVVLEIDN